MRGDNIIGFIAPRQIIENYVDGKIERRRSMIENIPNFEKHGNTNLPKARGSEF